MYLSLPLYLKRAGVISGPSSKLTRHSELSVFKGWLLCNVTDYSNPSMRKVANFGLAVHEAYLQNKWKRKIDKEERIMRDVMVDTLQRHPVCKRLYADSIREKRRKATLNGVKIGLTPDIEQSTTISDLKTTKCQTLAEFIIAAFEYGYFRQGKTYLVSRNLKDYFIIGIQKVKKKPKIFIVYINEHKEFMHYVEAELAFLLYFYSRYGRPIWKRSRK